LPARLELPGELSNHLPFAGCSRSAESIGKSPLDGVESDALLRQGCADTLVLVTSCARTGLFYAASRILGV
jgi:hypothetical protein